MWSRSTTPGETKLLASEIYELLQASSGGDCDPAEEAVSSRRKAQFFLGSSNKRAKTVVLHIDGLDDSVSMSRSSWGGGASGSGLHHVTVVLLRAGGVCVRRPC